LLQLLLGVAEPVAQLKGKHTLVDEVPHAGRSHSHEVFCGPVVTRVCMHGHSKHVHPGYNVAPDDLGEDVRQAFRVIDEDCSLSL
jgi:hypothetical protein